VLICCWSVKGGSGTTVVATALAALLARDAAAGALLVDLAGDVPAVLGCGETAPPDGTGLADWLAAGEEVPADGLARCERPVGRRLRLLERGDGPLRPARADVLGSVLGADPRPVVADCGVLGAAGPAGQGEAAAALAAAATRSLLVVRPCFLALRRAVRAPLRPSGVVLVVDDGRAITVDDVESVLGVPVLASLRVLPGIARAVDAGTLAGQLPRTLERELRHVA
jgi:hypothetical protein